jgi:hypothetical protein
LCNAQDRVWFGFVTALIHPERDVRLGYRFNNRPKQAFESVEARQSIGRVRSAAHSPFVRISDISLQNVGMSWDQGLGMAYPPVKGNALRRTSE